MAPSSTHSDSSSADGFSVTPASASQIQGISIRHHVHVILDMDEGNYGQWRHFFDSALGKIGLEGHVRSTTPDADRDGEWRMVDSCVVNWILATVSKGVFETVRHDRTMPSPCGTPSPGSSRTTRCSAPCTWRPSCVPCSKAT